MAQSQKKLNINVSFENELAQYLADMAEMQNKTIQEVLVDLVEEVFEADEGEKELVKLSLERDIPGAKRVKYEDVKWR
ncbi:MAG: hypothetical protein sL5_09830 [Candidatus Mesenet longicola]|uniref:Uncharacterized protein n=1 Tax=Candidatus Mesenet longicola TaxID=1892558 RepID=A0A8J3MPK0_9RICK|nr:MAG: hypothetical protein sGL2_10320 [Candidatus Mesenet longicola]GHM59990.1 MAG: hypothetical protein sL5_09830 [Candidatus Mesenet longicola]